MSEDLDELRFNTAVSQLMIFTNHMTSIKILDRDILHKFLILLNNFAPHVTEELNEKIGFSQISSLKWPNYDDTLIIDEKIRIAIQFNGKKRGVVEILPNTGKEDVYDLVKNTSFGEKYLSEFEVIRIIYVPDKISDEIKLQLMNEKK